VPELNHTAAELSIDIKNKFSHRGQANRILVKKLLDEKLILKQK
jgi:inosine/xanthosine triphosphate pyrophosphatase family protein